MLAPTWLRKTILAFHITVSVGWIGGVVAYVVLDLRVAATTDVGTLRSLWIAMALITKWALLPFSFAALASGILLSLVTKWGLFRHYWVVLSLILTAIAVAVLLSETRYILEAAVVAGEDDSGDAEVRALQPTLLHSIGGLVVLLLVQVLNVFKPRGLTKHGWRKQREADAAAASG